jgi:GNAT superfamily N-acetyltransferase
MTINHSNELIQKVRLRDLQLPEDYVLLANLFNLIEHDSTSAQALEGEDKHIPTISKLSKDENGLLLGFGRTRVIAETLEGKVIGYGASWRAPWSDPGEVASSFCVHPDFRRQGVGEMILNHIENWANEHQAFVLLSEVKDWMEDSLPFVQKRGFAVDAHVYELNLNLNQFDSTKFAGAIKKVMDSGIRFMTLADINGEESEQKVYQLYIETSKDNPGQSGSIPEFSQWRKEALPVECSREDWVFIAVDGERFVGVTTLFNTEEPGVIYTDYTGVQKETRGRGIAQALKLLSIHAALKAGAHTMTTDTEDSNLPMQSINRKLGYQPGKGHYRIRKQY